MANTIIPRDDHSVRLPYRWLGYILATIQDRLPPGDPARRLIDPWLAHIEEDMGYVNLDEALLEDREGVRWLRGELDRLADEVSRGEVPDRFHAPWRRVDHYFDPEITTDTCRRLAAFLELVIADQAEEDAGRKPPPITREERRRRQKVRRQWGPGGNPNVLDAVVGRPTRRRGRTFASSPRRRDAAGRAGAGERQDVREAIAKPAPEPLGKAFNHPDTRQGPADPRAKRYQSDPSFLLWLSS